MDAGLADDRDAMTEAGCQGSGTVEVNRHIAQIAIVDADHFSLQRNCALQFLFIAHFGQHAHVQAMRDGGELTILLIVQHRKHQQTGISLVVARQVDLIRIDSKVLTQNRLRRDLADHRQKIEAALEILLIAKH